MYYREEYSTISARYPNGDLRAVILKQDGKEIGFTMDTNRPVYENANGVIINDPIALAWFQAFLTRNLK